MLFVLFIFLIVSSICLLFVSFSRKNIEEVIPLSIFLIIIIIYIAGLCGQLEIGIYLVIAFAIISFFMSITRSLLKKEFKILVSRTLTPAFSIFIILNVILFLANYHRLATSWDEFSHWADIVKVMYTINDYGTNPLSNSGFQSYPPAMSIFQYFALKVSDGYNEWLMYYAYQIAALSLFMPFLNGQKHKCFISNFFVVIIVLVTPTIYFKDFFNIIYVDAFLGLIFGFIVGYIFNIKEIDITNLLTINFTLIVLTLTKDAGLFFAAIAVLLLVHQFILGTYEFKSFLTKKYYRFILPFSSSLSVFISKVSWDYEVRKSGVTPRFSGKIDIKELITILIDKNLNYRYTMNYRKDVLDSFISTLFSPFIQIGPIIFSPFQILIILAIQFYILFFLYSKLSFNKVNKGVFSFFFLFYFSFIIYIFGMLASYMYKFSEYEATYVASFDRYISIIFSAGTMFFVLSMLKIYISKTKQSSVVAIILAIMIIFAPHSYIFNFISRGNVYSSIMLRAPYEALSARAASLLNNKSSKLFVISQESTGFDYYVLRYSFRPYTISVYPFSWSLGEPFYEGDVYSVHISADEWKNALINERYDYVVLYKINEYFINNYSSLFDDPSSIVEHAIYELDEDKGLLRLIDK